MGWLELDHRNKSERYRRTKTIYDLIRHRATLEVICGNCDNHRALNHRFLMTQFGAQHYLAALRFRCRRCGGRRYRLRTVADSLGEPEPLKLQYFAGVYEKLLD